jgi:hypothetical protein
MILKPLLELAALILGLVNGLMLLRGYTRDRPVLKVEPVHPDTYQWFFRLPAGEFKGEPTRRYGFLAYVDVLNKGRRDVSLCSWRLWIRTKGGKRFESKPMSITEPNIELHGSYTKVYPVLGTRGLQFQGDTLIKSGQSISGFCYYVVELWGTQNWDLAFDGRTTTAEIAVQSAFGNKARSKILFKEISLERANVIIPGIENIGREQEIDQRDEAERG